MEETPYEIERKYLIRMPDLDWLNAAASRSHIVQTYLLSDQKGRSERVRSRTDEDQTVYTHTKKTRVTAMKRIEIEKEISFEEYERLLQRADPKRRAIEKDRYCLHTNGLVYEIDVFPFWNDRAFLEIELKDENQTFPWPEGLECIREVTDDGKYTNSALALQIPEEELQKEEKK